MLGARHGDVIAVGVDRFLHRLAGLGVGEFPGRFVDRRKRRRSCGGRSSVTLVAPLSAAGGVGLLVASGEREARQSMQMIRRMVFLPFEGDDRLPSVSKPRESGVRPAPPPPPSLRRRRCTGSRRRACTPFCLSALISVTRMRVPLAPIGWPSAVAPPWTLILSCGMPRSFIANMATQAKASLTSHRSTSSTFQPAFLSTFSIAPIGATVNCAGSCAWAAVATIRATGVEALFLGGRFPGQDDRGGAVGNRDRGGGGDRPFLGEGGLQLRDLVGAAAARRLVGVDDGVAACGPRS